MPHRLRILDVGLTLSGPDSVWAPIARAYRRFALDGPLPSELGIRVADDVSAAEVDGRRVALLPDLDPTLQAYQLFLNGLMDGLGSHALLHAAALGDGRGGAMLLAAPSGHGKTSLTLELASRGCGFLGDDYAPLALDASRVVPYPRAVGLVPDGTAPIPRAFREAAARYEGPMLLGKKLLDVGDVLGEASLVREPLPLRHVLLLASDERGAVLSSTWLRVAALEEHAGELERLFESTDGVEVAHRAARARLRTWQLKLSHDRRPTAALSRAIDSDRVLFAEKIWDTTPDFGGEPAAARVPRREAAELLGRELLNRRTGGRLLARYDGNLTALFLDLAGALREAACWRVRVGAQAATAELILDLAGR